MFSNEFNEALKTLAQDSIQEFALDMTDNVQNRFELLNAMVQNNNRLQLAPHYEPAENDFVLIMTALRTQDEALKIYCLPIFDCKLDDEMYHLSLTYYVALCLVLSDQPVTRESICSQIEELIEAYNFIADYASSKPHIKSSADEIYATFEGMLKKFLDPINAYTLDEFFNEYLKNAN